jgi:hypothetical protein
MADAPRILIAGGTGVFGRLLAHELLTHTPAELIIAARDDDRAAAVCRSLNAPQRVMPMALDLSRPERLAVAARGCFAVACAAGPFQGLPRALPAAAVAVGAHWLDIADDPGWLLTLLADRDLHAAAAAAGVAVVPGLSTTPALSGVLVRWCRQRLPEARRARVTLFIGNRNAKGAGAIASLLGAHVRAARAVHLPVGRRIAYRFDTADAALLQAELGIAVEFRVTFEWEAAGRLLAAFAPFGGRLDPDRRIELARLLSRLARPFSGAGSDLGILQAELRAADGGRIIAALSGAGQRLAVLPCTFAIESLLRGGLHPRGVLDPATWQMPDTWIERLLARGISFRGRGPFTPPAG